MSLVVDGLCKRFVATGAQAVDKVAFTAPKAAITTVLGPSGSGKTTVLRLIAGLEVADAGTITVEGRDWTRTPVRKRKVGLVFQGYALFQHMTVKENIAFGLRAQKAPRSEIDGRVRELLELVQLSEVGARFPSQLSGGQQQRIAFARALAPRPDVLLLDEPFGALDAHVRVELRRWLSDLHHRTGVTTILVTHDQDEALEISHQIVVMQAGRVEQIGSPREIYDHPASAFVASFVGAANRLRGRVEGGRATVGRLTIDAPPGVADGASVQAFVRPHDVRLERATEDNGAMQLAVVLRLVRVGGFTKIDLQLASGECMTVQLAAREADALAVADGDSVLVDLHHAKVFVEDYSI
jgi:sulfate transport system ATP-binding protein